MLISKIIPKKLTHNQVTKQKFCYNNFKILKLINSFKKFSQQLKKIFKHFYKKKLKTKISKHKRKKKRKEIFN